MLVNPDFFLMKRILLLFIIIQLCSISFLFAQHTKKDGSPDRRYKENRSSSSSPSYHSTTSHHRSNYIYSLKRDKHGHIKRSESAKRDFMKQSGFPKGRPGYVVDHIVPLKKGGCDCASNMQWQTKEAGKQKDKCE